MTAREIRTWRLGRHELSLQLKQWRIGVGMVPAGLLLAAWTGVGFLLATRLDPAAIPDEAVLRPTITLAILFATTLFLSQALLQATRALFTTGDLQLLMSAPVSGRRIVAAKMLGIAWGILAIFGPALLPILLPFAILHDWRWLGAAAMLVILAWAAAAMALSLLIAIAGVAGSRRAQTAGNILAAIFGGLFFLFTQLAIPAMAALSALDGGHPLLAPARGALGDPVALVAAALATAALALAAARFAGGRIRAISNEAAATPRRSGGSGASLAARGLLGAIVIKEWRLLSREPELLFQVLLRMIYLVPLLWIIVRGRDEDMLLMAAGIAFIAGQLCGSIAWLTVSGEDVPDLLATAPVPRRALQRAKLAAAFLPSLVLLALACGIFARWSPAAAVTAFATGAMVALAAGSIELKLARPMPRAAFGKSKEGSFPRSMLILAVSLAIAAGGTWLGSQFFGGLA